MAAHDDCGWDSGCLNINNYWWGSADLRTCQAVNTTEVEPETDAPVETSTSTESGVYDTCEKCVEAGFSWQNPECYSDETFSIPCPVADGPYCAQDLEGCAAAQEVRPVLTT